MSESNQPPRNRQPASRTNKPGQPVFKPVPPDRKGKGVVAKVAAPKAPKTRWQRIRPWLIFVPVIPFVAVMLLYATVVYGFKSPDSLMQGSQGLQILDRNGVPLQDFGDEPGSGQVVPLNAISTDLINATVAAEDANFWKNPGGVSIKGLARAAYENVAFWKNGGFFNGSGGSSITQQLAKNLYIKPEDRYKRSATRKVKETLYAFELNRRYSKQQILSWYLSNVYYGNGAYGIDSAAHRYFNKAPIDLTLPEAAMLAGLPQAPNYYDPLNNFDGAMARQKQILNLMVRHKYLNQDQENEALAKPPVINEGADPAAAAKASGLAPHFAAYVKDLLPTLLDKSKISGRLKVTTSIDSVLQAKAEDAVTTQLDKFEKAYGASNGALVAMDPATGQILAMVGSHDFNRADISGQVNNATALNEPGSTLKPVTYMTAFLKGWAPSTMVTDEAIKVPNGDGETSYTLGNADNKYRGSVPVREALASSLNVPAVKALQYAGLDQVYAMAKKMGVSSLKDISNYGPAFTLGGVDVNLVDMTYVYSVFANQGEQAGMPTMLDGGSGSRALEPIAVLKIETPDGKLLWKPKPKQERIVPAAATYLVTSIISDDSARASMFGTGSALNLAGRPSAVKTGSSDETRDLLAIGYTPSLVAGVWVGNANNKPMTGTSSLVAAPIWNAFMASALQGKPVQQFTVPDGIEFGNVCATTGQAPTNSCSKVVKEAFFSGKLPSGVKAVSKDAPTSAPQKALPTYTPQPSPSPTPNRNSRDDNNNRDNRDNQRSATPTVTNQFPFGQPNPQQSPGAGQNPIGNGNSNGNGNNNNNRNGNNGNGNTQLTPQQQNQLQQQQLLQQYQQYLQQQQQQQQNPNGFSGGLLPQQTGPGAGLASTPTSGR